MADRPLNPPVELTTTDAEAILRRWLGREARVLRSRRLTGGCCNTVIELSFDAPGSPVVLKLAHGADAGGIAAEHAALQFLRGNTRFPVPEPFSVDVSAHEFPYSYLIMQRVPGVNLGDARLSAQDRVAVQREMAAAVAELHTHTRSRFGNIGGSDAHDNWAAGFQRRLRQDYEDLEGTRLLSDAGLRRLDAIVDAVPRSLDAPGRPTLVHGDIWATNIMVDQGRLTGFLDPGGIYAHPEYELAYLEIWHTADDTFFDVYHAHHPRIEGYEQRREIYWLHTLLVHVWLFQADHYVRSAEALLAQLQP